MFASDGYVVVPAVLGEAECQSIEARLAGVAIAMAGNRSLLDFVWCAELAGRLRAHPLLAQALPADAVAIQCTLFEKSTDRNWLVPLHQDLSVPVAERIDHPELSGWSEKEGGLFVQPPPGLLEQLVAVRLHIDECGLADGPLRVVPGSHLAGRTDTDAALRLRDVTGETVCPVPRGGVLLMRPLLLHASSKASGRSLRRVLHFLFGPRQPPLGLNWRHAV